MIMSSYTTISCFLVNFFPVADSYHSGDKQAHERVHIHKSVVRPVYVCPAVRNMKKRSRKAVRKYYDEHDSRRDGKCCQEALHFRAFGVAHRLNVVYKSCRNCYLEHIEYSGQHISDRTQARRACGYQQRCTYIHDYIRHTEKHISEKHSVSVRIYFPVRDKVTKYKYQQCKR